MKKYRTACTARKFSKDQAPPDWRFTLGFHLTSSAERGLRGRLDLLLVARWLELLLCDASFSFF
jgi:hypothetical protein